MKESSSRMKYVDTENTHGLMENNMKVSGVTIKCMVKVYLFGKTRRSIKVNLLMTSVKVMEHSVGLTEGSMLDNGKQASNMVMELI